MLKQTRGYPLGNKLLDRRTRERITACCNNKVLNRAHTANFIFPTLYMHSHQTQTYFCFTSRTVKMTYNYTLQFVYLSRERITKRLILCECCHCSSFCRAASSSARRRDKLYFRRGTGTMKSFTKTSTECQIVKWTCVSEVRS